MVGGRIRLLLACSCLSRVRKNGSKTTTQTIVEKKLSKRDHIFRGQVSKKKHTHKRLDKRQLEKNCTLHNRTEGEKEKNVVRVCPGAIFAHSFPACGPSLLLKTTSNFFSSFSGVAFFLFSGRHQKFGSLFGAMLLLGGGGGGVARRIADLERVHGADHTLDDELRHGLQPLLQLLRRGAADKIQP